MYICIITTQIISLMEWSNFNFGRDFYVRKSKKEQGPRVGGSDDLDKNDDLILVKLLA